MLIQNISPEDSNMWKLCIKKSLLISSGVEHSNNVCLKRYSKLRGITEFNKEFPNILLKTTVWGQEWPSKHLLCCYAVVLWITDIWGGGGNFCFFKCNKTHSIANWLTTIDLIWIFCLQIFKTYFISKADANKLILSQMDYYEKVMKRTIQMHRFEKESHGVFFYLISKLLNHLFLRLKWMHI